MPEPIVTRGLELCSGYGTTPEQTPRMASGSISRWVCSGVRFDSTSSIPSHPLHRSFTMPSSPGFIQSTSILESDRPQCLHFAGGS
jgi:hypothetical protein